MDEKRSSSGLAVAVTWVLIAASLGLYVAGYFALGKRDDVDLGPDLSPFLGSEFRPDPDDQVVWRAFEHEWLVDVYKPMAAIEKAVTGADVNVGLLGYDFEFTIGDSE